MRLLADEHVPPAIASALRDEGHDVAIVGDDVDSGSEDLILLEYARETERLILSEDTDFRGADSRLAVEEHPGVLACDTAASPGEIAAAIRRIERYTSDLTETVLYVPGNWLQSPTVVGSSVEARCDVSYPPLKDGTSSLLSQVDDLFIKIVDPIEDSPGSVDRLRVLLADELDEDLEVDSIVEVENGCGSPNR